MRAINISVQMVRKYLERHSQRYLHCDLNGFDKLFEAD